MAKSKSTVHEASDIEIRLVSALESIAQSLRDIEAKIPHPAKKGQPRIVQIGQATYTRVASGSSQDSILSGPEAGSEVPGFRRR